MPDPESRQPERHGPAKARPARTELARPPQQERSRESSERVIAAGLKVLEEVGHEGLAVSDVSRRSGVSIGSIYARFGSKEELCQALQQRILETVGETQRRLFGQGWDGLSPDEAVFQAVEALATVFRTHAPLLRVLILRGAVDELTRSGGSESTREVAALFSAVLVPRARALGIPDPERAVDVCFRMIYSAMARRVIYGPTFESPRALEWDAFVAELGTACAAYLRYGASVAAEHAAATHGRRGETA